jgi:hypothetical protein
VPVPANKTTEALLEGLSRDVANVLALVTRLDAARDKLESELRHADATHAESTARTLEKYDARILAADVKATAAHDYTARLLWVLVAVLGSVVALAGSAFGMFFAAHK